MRILVIGLIALGAMAASIPQAQSQNSARPTAQMKRTTTVQ
jgi:hypothetical protein